MTAPGEEGSLTDETDPKEITMKTRKETTLVVPPYLARDAYAVLVATGCVPRRWHPEGRYGSRTHVVDGVVKRIGLPLCQSDAVRQRLASLQTFSSTPSDDDDDDDALRTLLCTPGVQVLELPVAPSRIPRAERVDATVHPERAQASQFVREAADRFRRWADHVSDHGSSDKIDGAPFEFTYGELFSGIGGFGVALDALGGRCIFASEVCPTAMSIYRANFPRTEHCSNEDVTRVEFSTSTLSKEESSTTIPVPPHLDLLVGGFPCQSFSSLGDMAGLDDARGLLYREVVRCLVACQPRAFLLENVPGLLLTDHGRALEAVLEGLTNAGYDVTWEVVDARCLTVQSRKRVYLVGIRRDLSSSSNQTKSKKPKPFCFPYLPDLGLRAGDVLEDDDEIDDIDETVLASYRLTVTQLEVLQGKPKWKPSHLAWPDKTLHTLDGHYGVTVSKGNSQLVPCHPPHPPRRFTPRECARIMGFPNSFRLWEAPHRPFQSQSQSQQSQQPPHSYRPKQLYKLLGNAVCPPVVAGLAGAVLHHIGCLDVDSTTHTDTDSHTDTTPTWTAVRLAMEAIPPSRRVRVYRRLAKEFHDQAHTTTPRSL